MKSYIWFMGEELSFLGYLDYIPEVGDVLDIANGLFEVISIENGDFIDVNVVSYTGR